MRVLTLFLALLPCFSRAELIRAGFGETDITPPVGYRHAGGYEEIVSTGVHDPLKAKAVVLEQAGTSFALVMCDLLSVPGQQSIAIRERFSQLSGIPVAHIIAAATHNHGSPEHSGPLRNIFHDKAVRQYGRDPLETVDYPTLLIDRCVEALQTAHMQLQPVTLDFAIAAQPGLAYNRRYYMNDGSVRFNPGKGNPLIDRPVGPVDTDLPVLIARSSASNEALGGFTLFAMHTAVFGGTEFGADFPGHLQTSLRSHFGDHFISIFGEGCAGDINHVRTFTREPDPTPEQIGETLSATIVAHEKHFVRLSEPSLAVRSETVFAPVKPVSNEDFEASKKVLEQGSAPFLELVNAWRICHAWDIQQRHGTNGKPLEVQVLRLDAQTALVTLPHEVFVEIGLAIKAASPFRHTMVLSLANDVDYYVPTRRAFEEGSYEVTTCPLEPGCGELLIDTARKLLNAVKP
jgi:neutral ceramidase